MTPTNPIPGSYTSILIALDTAKGEPEATAHAKRLINQAKLLQPNTKKLHLFHACEHPITGYGEITGKNHAVNESQIRQEAYKPLKKWAESHNIPASNIHIVFGDIPTRLTESCLSNSIDLVIIGSHAGRSFQLFGANTTDDIIHHMISDVLTVKL